MFKEFSIQAFSVRNKMESYEDIKKCFNSLAQMGYTGVQTAGAFKFCTAEQYAAAARTAGLKIIGTHNYIPELDKMDEFIAELKVLGTTNGGIGGLKEPSVKVWCEKIEHINRVAEVLAKHGMKFTYHQHSWEFGKLEGVRPIDLLYDGLDKNNVSIVLDTYWILAAGGDINAMLEKFAGRVDILHLKGRALDYQENAPYMAPLSDGNTDFVPIIKTAWDTGVKHICVEQDNWANGADSLECAAKSADYLKRILEI